MTEITCQTKGCPAYGKAFTIMAGTLECGLCGYAPHDKPSRKGAEDPARKAWREGRAPWHPSTPEAGGES